MLAVTWDARKHGGLLDRHPYVLSEKYDGVRAHWDGRRLTTRGGHVIHAPVDFLHLIPATPLDGELYMGVGRFNEVSGVVRKTRPVPGDWKDVRFLVFDDPISPLPFAATHDALKKLLPSCTVGNKVCLIRQHPVSSVRQVEKTLDKELERGGEGVMLRRADTPYRKGRAATLIKVKGEQDAEAIVVGYEPGKGRLVSTLGALKCVWAKHRGVHFNVGSGLTDEMRSRHAHLFPFGSQVTVQFMSLDPRTGRPRHPRLKGLRTDL